MSLIKSKLLETALTLCQNFSSDQDPPTNQTPFKAFKYLTKKTNKNIVIRKADLSCVLR